MCCFVEAHGYGDSPVILVKCRVNSRGIVWLHFRVRSRPMALKPVLCAQNSPRCFEPWYLRGDTNVVKPIGNVCRAYTLVTAGVSCFEGEVRGEKRFEFLFVEAYAIVCDGEGVVVQVDSDLNSRLVSCFGTSRFLVLRPGLRGIKRVLNEFTKGVVPTYVGTKDVFDLAFQRSQSSVIDLRVFEGKWVERREAHWHVSDRKSTRLNSSHLGISYAVFCLKKKINSGISLERQSNAGDIVYFGNTDS